MRKIINKIKRNEQNSLSKRIFVIIIVLFFIHSILPLSCAEDWPMYRKSPDNNGYIESKVTTTNNTKWIKKLNGDISAPPIIAERKVLLATNNHIYILDEDTGEEINNISVRTTESSSSLLYYQEKIYYSGGGLDCYNAINGTIIWHKSFTILGSPIYCDGKIIANEGYKISALDPNTGDKIWESELDIDYSPFGQSTPAIASDENLVFICVEEKGPEGVPGIWCALLGFDIDTGEQKWEMHFDGYFFATCVIRNNYIYNNHLINISSKEAFTGIIPSFHDTLPVVAENRIYCGGFEKIICKDLDGTTIWEYREDGTYFSTPTVTKNQVLIGNSRGWIYSIDIENGKILWSFETEGNKCLSPVVADEYIFVTTDNGYIYCFGQKDKSNEYWILGLGFGLIIIALIILIVLNRYMKKK